MFDVGRVVAYQPLPDGHRLAIVTNASGPARMAQDACTAAGLVVVEPIIDLSLSARPDDYRTAIDAVCSSAREQADAMLVIAAPTKPAPADAVAGAVAAATTFAPIPVVLTLLAAPDEPDALRFSDGRRVPCFRSPEEAVHAIGKAAAHAAWRRRPAAVRELAGIDVGSARAVVDELLSSTTAEVEPTTDAVDAVLAAFGITVTGRRGVDGVALTARIVQDPEFGPLVALGMGGQAAELLGDRVYRAVPLTDADASDLWRNLKTAPLLMGYAGSAPVATDALEDLLLRLGAMADAIPEIVELTLDPVIAQGHGVAVVNAHLRVAVARAPAVDAIRRLR
jgi:acyl-CoA synthetase (NDP forming)